MNFAPQLKLFHLGHTFLGFHVPLKPPLSTSPYTQTKVCGRTGTYLYSFIVSGADHSPTVGLKTSDDPSMTFSLHPVQGLKPFSRPDVPKFYRSIQRARNDAIIVELKTRDGVLMGVVQRQSTLSTIQIPNLLNPVPVTKNHLSN